MEFSIWNTDTKISDASQLYTGRPSVFSSLLSWVGSFVENKLNLNIFWIPGTKGRRGKGNRRLWLWKVKAVPNQNWRLKLIGEESDGWDWMCVEVFAVGLNSEVIFLLFFWPFCLGDAYFLSGKFWLEWILFILILSMKKVKTDCDWACWVWMSLPFLSEPKVEFCFQVNIAQFRLGNFIDTLTLSLKLPNSVFFIQKTSLAARLYYLYFKEKDPPGKYALRVKISLAARLYYFLES